MTRPTYQRHFKREDVYSPEKHRNVIQFIIVAYRRVLLDRALISRAPIKKTNELDFT